MPQNYKIRINEFSALIVLMIIGLTAAGCGNCGLRQKGNPDYIASIEKWHEQRINNLKKEDGWLNLVGLYWLSEGSNTFGTSPGDNIVFPRGKGPGVIGKFILKNGIVTVKINDGIPVLFNGRPVSEMEMKNDLSDDPTVLSLGYLRWFVIKRGDNMYGIRLRDIKAPLLTSFKGTDTYPINEDWKVTATAVPYKPAKIITVPSIIGTAEKDTINNSLEFNLQGKTFKLDPLKEGDQLFIIFADKTNGKETYGAGRFLYAALPDSEGKTVLDFNKAYNPPCAFTRYATCPLPPDQNYMNIEVTAGEKKYGEE